MTIKQATDRLLAQKPHAYTAAEVANWLSVIEGEIFAEIVQTHANPDEITFAGYTALTSDSTEMIAPSPYDELYLYFLMMQVDLNNLEYDKYNNSAPLFKSAFQAFANFWNREHMPVQRITYFKL